MASSSLVACCVLSLSILVSASPSMAFNITALLSKHKEFTTLNTLLSQTKLADEINRRQTITVLAIDDAGLAPLAGKPLAVVKNILSVHVILDFYDVEKLTKLGISNPVTTLTTLFQASGQAVGQQGFVNVSLVNEGEIAFGSAAGGNLTAKLVESVDSHPYNFSVLQITSPVQVPGIESGPVTPPPTAASVPTPAPKKPSPLTPKPAPTPKTVPAPAPKTTIPSPSPKTNVPSVAPMRSPAPKRSPSMAPEASAPASEGPAESEGPSSAEGPEESLDAPAVSPSEGSAADSEPPAPHRSGSSRGLVAAGAGAAAAAVVAALGVAYCLVD